MSSDRSSLTVGLVLRNALIAGLVAGLLAALFHYLATEPVLDQAIALESLAHSGHTDDPIVSRQAQQAGLFIGYVLLGLAWALVLTVVHQVVQAVTPGLDAARRARWVVLAAYWSVGLLPLLRFPANPPGIGDPDTIGVRQTLYLLFLASAGLGTALAVIAGSSLARRAQSRWTSWLIRLAIPLAIGGILFVAFPAVAEPVPLPEDLVLQFRLLAIAGTTLFWLVFGAGFSLLIGRTFATRAQLRPAD